MVTELAPMGAAVMEHLVQCVSQALHRWRRRRRRRRGMMAAVATWTLTFDDHPGRAIAGP
jgi:hypothetical protein